MANKQNKRPAPNPVPKSSVNDTKQPEAKSSFKLELASYPRLTPYLPGILLFIAAFLVTLLTYKDYGISWDEPGQRAPGLLSYNYVFHGSQDLFLTASDNHGAGFEMLLMIIEQWMDMTDMKDVYIMRHLVTNVFFLVSVFCGYVLLVRLFKNRLVAAIGFLMLLLVPRIYAHSFFNSKDLPFMSMMTICMMYFQSAFQKNKTSLYLLLGLACGYATSIRIMGIMLGGLVIFFMLIDLLTNPETKEKPKKQLANIGVFLFGFIFLLYLGWPYLWKHPIDYFIESYTHLSHFDFRGSNLINGKYEVASKLPWTYFPIWFLISNPEIWLLAGFAGIGLFTICFFKKPLVFFRNTMERNVLFAFACFIAPIFAVIVLHSVIYDDWRHLYFVYPAFVVMAVYFVHMLYETRFRMVALGVCGLQVVVTGFFMFSNHPHNQVYFNNLVTHAPEHLRKNFELDYWGCSFKQGMDYLLAKYPTAVIKINCNNRVYYDNNIMLVPEEDRKRIVLTTPENADFFLTNFREHPYDYPAAKVEYSIQVLNSTIFCIYQQEKDPVKLKQMREDEIRTLTKAIAASPSDGDMHARMGDAYFSNGQYDSAEAHHMRALKLKPTSVIINEMAGQYFGKGKYEQAINFCRRSLELNPDDVNMYTNIGLCYMRLSKFDSAVYNLTKAISIDSKYTANFINLAITYKAMGKMDSAKKYEEIVKKSDPNFKL